MAIKELLYAERNLTAAELQERFERKMGAKLAMASIVTYRAEFLDAMTFLRDHGWVEPGAASEPKPAPVPAAERERNFAATTAIPKGAKKPKKKPSTFKEVLRDHVAAEGEAQPEATVQPVA
ncbi:MAG: hypothetical protein ACREFD_10040 [Stellaceae bacterium]